MCRYFNRLFLHVLLAAALVAIARAESAFVYTEMMVPMRDGVRLQTVVMTPVKQKTPLPILLTRTPYGVPSKAFDTTPPWFKELEQDGYIIVLQNLRGRFKSE